jgi:hypothetical protein
MLDAANMPSTYRKSAAYAGNGHDRNGDRP